MARIVELPPVATLAAYDAYATLAGAVRELRAEAAQLVPALAGRTVWMVNSTATGGGVAEMLPTMVALLRELGVATEWVVIDSEEPAFFNLTKQLHNLIHGEGSAELGADARVLFERVNLENAQVLRERLRPGDVLAVHDPQPMPLAEQLRSELDIACVWRCHIGLDEHTSETRAAWEFLRPYADAYDHAIFSAPEYIPDFFSARARIIHPALDPLSHKSRDLSVHKISGILANAALAMSPGPVLTPPFERVAERLQPNGTFAPGNLAEDIGLLHRPIVTQISRWDRLKGFAPLLSAFELLKNGRYASGGGNPYHARRIDLVRLVLAGPDPRGVSDDPEALAVLEELTAQYCALDPAVQRDVALLVLPMHSRIDNALMVNALQRTSSIVVQNSLREGFGLTVTEAMWKGVPVLTNRRACGPRQQVRHRVDGWLIDDPDDPEAIAEALDAMLAAAADRDPWGRSAQRRAYERFLVFAQLTGWLRLLHDTVRMRH